MAENTDTFLYDLHGICLLSYHS